MKNGAWRLIRAVDRLNDEVGRGAAWLTLGLVLTCCAVAVLRYAFQFGAIWLQELYVWFHALIFVVGAGYTMKAGGHVRVDLLHAKMGPRGKAFVEIFGTIVFLAPWLAIVGWLCLRDAWRSLSPPNAPADPVLLAQFAGWLVLLMVAKGIAVVGLARAARLESRTAKFMSVLVGLAAAGLLGWFAAGNWGAVAHRLGEGSAQVGGMPAIWLLKLALPSMVLLLALQALAQCARAVLVLRGDLSAAPLEGGHG